MLFDDMKNLFSKKEPLKEPEEYDQDVYMINKYLSMEPTLLPVISEFTRYLWTLRGRYMYLLDGFLPQTDKRLFIKYTKNKSLTDKTRDKVRLVQQLLNCSGREGYRALLILEKEGVKIERVFGMKEAKDAKEDEGSQGTAEAVTR